MTVHTVGGGTVAKDPDQPSYDYGDVVTLTVTADPGWTFIESSGDLAGSHKPETLTIDGDKTVTATLLTLPVIDVWYGSDQGFGQNGIPQPWVNILGNVSDPDGVASLVYSLNGGPESALSIGPDGRRLVSPGDFNIDIPHTDLVSGANQVVITATDELDHQSTEMMTVTYSSGNVGPLPYSVDWGSVTNIQDVGHVVDGLWTLEADSVRTVEPGYDRLIAIGDVSWTDYEVTVPLTIHDMSGYGGAGILMRWNGHTDDPVSGWQPKSGWNPLGCIGWFRPGRLEFWGNNDEIIARNYSRTPATGVTYIFKMRVETIPGEGGLYSLRVWEYGQPEPSGWDLTAQEELSDPQNGSMMLIAYLWDASFGDVTITPGPFDDTTPPEIENIQITSGETSATVTWTTNEPATSTVAYGPSASYENGSVNDDMLVTEHTVTLTGLFPGMLYHCRITSADDSGNAASSDDLTFRTTGVPSDIVSDDFNACGLNTGLWTFVDPYEEDPAGRATLTMVGTHTEDAWVAISVPAHVSHDVWDEGNLAPRIMQPANDTDFEIEVKFESGLSQQYQLQGVLVEQDSDNYLRFDFYSDGSDTRIFAASFIAGTPSTRINSVIIDTDVAPLYMRVRREGDTWTLSYSYDGENWTTRVSFTHSLSVTSVGAFVGNAGSDPPAYTGSIDYFFNTASPIVLEDGDRNTLVVNTVGDGTVITEPAKSTYSCGEVVTLIATADPGWTFAGWSGDLSGTTSPATVTMTGNRLITATFTQDGYALAVNTVGDGSVTVEPDQATYRYGDLVTLTATADDGWTFASWSGALSGTDNPSTVTITGNTTITATFTQDGYTLTVNVVGDGSVTVEPDQATYHYGDLVTLTATADDGWTFAGWSGALSGTDNPGTVTITGNTAVTATFAQDEYTLTVNTVGDGSVAKDPDQATYHYGDVVTLTANPGAGCFFDGWSGHLSGSDNPETITMYGHRTVTANFGLASPPANTIDPVTGGTAASEDGYVSLEFPGGAVTNTTFITVTTATIATHPTDGFQFAGRTFDVIATDANGNPVTNFGESFTLIFTYDEADWQNAGIADESNLNLYWWNGSAWVALLPCAGCSHDTANNRFTIQFDHLTEFALLGDEGTQIYLPIITLGIHTASP